MIFFLPQFRYDFFLHFFKKNVWSHLGKYPFEASYFSFHFFKYFFVSFFLNVFLFFFLFFLGCTGGWEYEQT